jgi:hypothetical protein
MKSGRGVFYKETRRKALAVAADAVYGDWMPVWRRNVGAQLAAHCERLWKMSGRQRFSAPSGCGGMLESLLEGL